MNIQMVMHKAKQAFSYYKVHGFFSLLRKANATIQNSPTTLFKKTDVLGFYDFVLDRPYGSTFNGGVNDKTINWFIPPYGRGSGGHLNIFRFVFLLERLGYECRIVIVGGQSKYDLVEAKSQISEWFFPLAAPVYDGTEGVPAAFYSVATSWQTAYYVKNFQTTKHKCYFVQDFEPYFYAVGSESAMAEATYSFGFSAITAGSWLAEKLADEYQAHTFPISFSYDRDLYRLMHRREPEIKRIFFYARPPTQRRAFELGLLTLNEVVKRLPYVKVVFAGWDVSNYEIPFDHLNAGTLDVAKLPDLYNQCDAALVLSFTNLSLLPLELMACGVPVVSNRSPCTEWLLNDDNSILTKATVEDLTNGICELLTNSALHASIKAEGIRVANLSSWEEEALKLSKALTSISSSETLENSNA
ncbi:glycosyltransferase family 4 protein [Pseudomonas mandelii]|uniref:glycosyltransferase family 4 protein n=1 Tax=Pseudomonas mandelii TaxID=75612 RepID=UPI00209C802F|nr:glycosyltransferase family 4 protein [Pseudomonas mandelii]MCO8312168.1 glycosyltransferase family 4 protein [Pseudomonas mandelii]